MRAQATSPSAGVPNTAPISARVPVSHKVISWITGYPASPREAAGLPSQALFRGVSGTLTERQPSKATVRYRPNITPGVRGQATGPASSSNSAFTGATPMRRRRSRSARADGTARPVPSSAAVIFAHTPRYPGRGNNPSASTK